MTSIDINFLTTILGLSVFAVIVAVGWRSVQNRRILRVQGANGQETIIVAREDDEISTIVSTAGPTPPPVPTPSVVIVNTGEADPTPPTFGKREAVV